MPSPRTPAAIAFMHEPRLLLSAFRASAPAERIRAPRRGSTIPEGDSPDAYSEARACRWPLPLRLTENGGIHTRSSDDGLADPRVAALSLEDQGETDDEEEYGLGAVYGDADQRAAIPARQPGLGEGVDQD